jgi:hypothetical protein
MRRIAFVAGALLASMAWPQVAGASGDFVCTPNWRLPGGGFSSCGNTAMLSPGNDTRVNLLFLMRDRQAASSAGPTDPEAAYAESGLGRNFFSWSMMRRAHFPRPEADEEHSGASGSRCISLQSGGGAFAAAMAANRGIPAAERVSLAQARGTIAKACEGGSGLSLVVPPDIRSAPGREFLTYLQGADAFYGEQWDAARRAFGKLRGSKDSWLAETAAYMLARTELNAAQAASFDEWGSFDAAKVDGAALGRARAGFQDYLKRYAQGRYAGSAQGLVRRTLWLAGDAAGLAREYERLLAAAPLGAPATLDLLEETDNKLLIASAGKVVDGPLLLATVDLMLMREPQEGGPPVISAAQIAGQAKSFSGRADLYGFVLAAHAFYVEKNPAQVLQLIPDDARQPGYRSIAFSRQVLRGMALAARGDRNEAGFWRELLGGATGLYQRPIVELALAMNLERSGRLADVFAPASLIGESAIREILLLNVAGPDLLRAQARSTRPPQHERDLALFTLLQKQLARGDYAGFLRDSALVNAGAASEGGLWDLREQEQIPVGLFRKATWSDGYPCPALSVTAAALARDPQDVKGRLCLGDFYRLNGFDDFGPDFAAPQRGELGGTPSLFPGRPTPRGDFYASVIADAKAGGDDKAYALYRAVKCYAPAGNNQCGGADVAASQRRAWFQRLKTTFPKSRWAQQLRYYW